MLAEEQLALAIDSILPQTQCELCGYKGCLPYAKAIAAGRDDIAQCHPGGIKTLQAIAKLTQQDPAPYQNQVIANTKPRMLAVIDESLCIGCTKCIQACPVDAIVGHAKKMHTVIADECTGCELCLDPCPMDCINLNLLNTDEPINANLARKRYQARQIRLTKLSEQQEAKRQKNKALQQQHSKAQIHNRRQLEIAAAVARAKNKKNNP